MHCQFIHVVQFNETNMNNIATQIDNREPLVCWNPEQLHIEKFDGGQMKFTLRRSQVVASFHEGLKCANFSCSAACVFGEQTEPEPALDPKPNQSFFWGGCSWAPSPQVSSDSPIILRATAKPLLQETTCDSIPSCLFGNLQAVGAAEEAVGIRWKTGGVGPLAPLQRHGERERERDFTLGYTEH